MTPFPHELTFEVLGLGLLHTFLWGTQYNPWYLSAQLFTVWRLLFHPPPEPAYIHPRTHTGILRCPLVWSLGSWWWGYGSAAGHPVCFSPLKRGEEMSLFIHLIQCLSTRWFLLMVEEGVNYTSTQTVSCWVGLGARWFHRWYQEASLLVSLSVSSCPLSLSSFLPFSLCLYLSVSPVPSGLLFNSCVLTLALGLGSILGI